MDDWMRDRLRSADAHWAAQEIPENEFPPVPDGKYNAIISDLVIKESRSGTLMLKWELQITSSTHGAFGRKIFMNNMLEGEYAWISKKNLLAVGMEIEHLVDLPAKIATVLEKEIEITLKTTEKNGQFNQNCFINKPLEEVDADEESSI